MLAHSISIINVQAGAASHHLETDPEKTHDALAIVRDTGKQALRELRSSLGVLRAGDGGAGALRTPSPGMRDIEQLVAATREAGLPVDLHLDGDTATVPADVGLAVYRIVQESLTNVTRHGGTAIAVVTIDRDPEEILVRVEDDGTGCGDQPADGHGIAGMRERVAALGGRLDVGPGPDGGFLVEGHIPLGPNS